jgi:hypothetical protein
MIVLPLDPSHSASQDPRMQLDIGALQIQSFATATEPVSSLDVTDTGKGGPDSLCYICYETGNFVPSCLGYECS